jgi:hypothetical protein
MDIILLRDKIENKIAELEQERSKINALAAEKADSISQYDRLYARKLLELKNGLILEWEGFKVGQITATMADKVARGMVFESCMQKELSEGLYRSCISNIEALKSELNGFQSINKYLE